MNPPQQGGAKIAASQALAALQVSGCDFLKVGGNMELIKFLDKNAKQIGVEVEAVQFSDSVLKINKRDKQQQRDLIITTAGLYNFKQRVYKTCQRAIPITSLKGIVISRASNEVLIQVRSDYDYRMMIVRQADAIRVLCEVFEARTGSKLNVEVVEDLSTVQVLKADVKKMKHDEGAGGEDSPRNNAAAASTSASAAAASSSSAASASAPGHTRGSFSSSASSIDFSGIDLKPGMEGWLTKKGQVNSLYKRRYFRLSESNLLYYEARLKGTIELVDGGEVRAWVNKRLSLNPHGASSGLGSPSSPSSADPHAQPQQSSTATGGLAPLLYEYKLSATYRVNPEKHLKDILLDPDRFAAFAAFAETIAPPPPPAGSSVRQGATEGANPRFYAAVERFKTLSSSASTLADAQGILTEANRIYAEFLSPETNTPINVPAFVREAVGDLLARQSNASSAAAAAGGASAASASAPSMSSRTSSAMLTSDLFNISQQFVLEYMQAAVLPMYLEHSKQSEATIVKDFKLKAELNEADKKKPSCFNCLATFSLLKRRYVCKYCGDVFCSNCLSKSSKLPAEYGIAEAIKVCDMCFGSLEISHVHPHAFSYANKARNRPINLAASSPHELQAWMSAFRACIAMQSAARSGGASAASSSSAAPAAVCHKEGWLMKEDPTTKIWRRRYFILNSAGAQLFYYELNLKGSLSLAQGAGVHATTQKATLSQADSQFGGLLSRTSFGFRFNISYGTRLYALSADTEEQMEKWMEALQKAIRRAKPGAGGGLFSLLGSNDGKGPLLPNSPSGANGLQVSSPNGAASAEHYSSSFAQKAPEGEVTFVFTDVQNSTKLWELAPEAMNKALEAHDALLRMLLGMFRGYEVKTEGDAFMVTFFNPLDAVRWCLACQQALLENTWPADLLRQPSGSREELPGFGVVWNGIRIRMGIHFGQPACRRNPITGRMDYFGPVVNRSARITDSAHGGQVVCTAETRERIVAGIAANEFPSLNIELTDLGTHRYKGITETVQIYQIYNKALAGRNPFPPLRTTKADEEPAGDDAASPASVGPASVIREGDENGGDKSPPARVWPPPPPRPSHLTVDSISHLSIHPYTPTALQRQGSPDDHDSDESAGSDSDDEEDAEDQRVERERQLQAASPSRTSTAARGPPPRP